MGQKKDEAAKWRHGDAEIVDLRCSMLNLGSPFILYHLPFTVLQLPGFDLTVIAEEFRLPQIVIEWKNTYVTIKEWGWLIPNR